MTTFQRATEVKDTYRGGFINQTGAYTGTFENAYYHTSASGAKAIHFDFVADDGASNSFDIYYWTPKDGGKELDIGMGIIQEQLMNLLRVNTLKESPGVVSVYDWNTQSNVDKNVITLPGLINKRIGIVFQETAYQRTKARNGSMFGTNFQPVFYFDAETSKTAKELVDKAPEALALPKYLENLAPIYVPKNIRVAYYAEINGEDANIQSKAATQQPTQTSMPPSYDDFDEDIPF